jgi:CelD/BcsL family acetyltransferase involved in cellulose biosynthesis
MFDVAIENSFDFRSAEYAELFACSSATAFQHPMWLAELYARLVKQSRAEPLIVVVRNRTDRRLALVLPLIRRRYSVLKVVEFADLRVSDYVSPVAEPLSFERIVADHEAVAAIRRHLKPYDVLRIGKLPDRSLPLERLLGIEKRENMGMSAYPVALEKTFAEWRQRRLNRSYAKELDKKSRQLNKRGKVSFTCSEDLPTIEATFEALKVYRRKRFDGVERAGDLLQVAAFAEFYMAVATAGRGSFVRTYTLSMDGKPIAGAVGLSHRDALLIILGGFDEENYRKQSIGSLLFQEVARDCIARGERFLDFTIGDEPYKRVFGAEPSPMWQISRAGSPLGYAADLVVENLPAAKSLARRLFRGHKGAEPAVEPTQLMSPPPASADEPAAS